MASVRVPGREVYPRRAVVWEVFRVRTGRVIWRTRRKWVARFVAWLFVGADSGYATPTDERRQRETGESPCPHSRFPR